MRKIICCFMVCLLIMTAFAPPLSAAAPSAVVEGSADLSKWLSLSTNTTGARYVVDSNGEPVRLFGMARCQNHADEEDVLFSDTADVDALTEHYRELGCNIMRLAINCDDICREGGGVSEEEINRFISKNIDPDVQAIIRSGMYVMLDIHMYPPDAPEGVNGADYTVQYAYENYLPMLTALAKKYADEPMIAVIEIWNEPYPADQEELEFDTDEWNSLVRQYFIDAVNEIRKYDERHILMVSDWNAGWGCAVPETWDGYYDQLDPVYRNTAHSIHVAAEHLDTGFSYYKSWYENLAANKNICLIFGEIETEGDLMTTAGMQNLIQMFSDTKDSHYFSGMLWRPHGDEANYVDVWKDWAKEYISYSPSRVLREIIEAENFYDRSGAGEIVKESLLFGNYYKGSGVSLSKHNTANEFYEAAIPDKAYAAGDYTVTVTAVADESRKAGFTLGYRTANGEIHQIADMQGNNTAGEIYNQTVSFTADDTIVGIVFFSNTSSANSVIIDRVYLIGNSDSAVDSSSLDIAKVKKIYKLDATVLGVENTADNYTVFNQELVLNPDHWCSDSLNYNDYETGIVMGHSSYSDAHYSSLYQTANIELIEKGGGNYFEVTTSNGWDADLYLRYGPHGDDEYYVNTSGATHVYMTVKFTAENLELFKNAKIFSKNTIGSDEYSRNGDTALILALGDNSGVTFNTWKKALEGVTPDEWITLKLAVSNGDGAAPSATQKNFYFKFGEQLSAVFCIKGVYVTSEQANAVYTTGARAGANGLRFVSCIDKSLLPESAKLLSFGTLVSYGDAYKFGEGDLVKNAFIVRDNTDYRVTDIVPQDNEITVSDNNISYFADIIGISEYDYNTDFSACAYVTYSLNGAEYTVYGNSVTRSLYKCANAAVNEAADINDALNAVINNVESKTNVITETFSEYKFSGTQWYPQLAIDVMPTAAADCSYIQFNLACSDIETVIDNFIAGSRSSVGGGDFSYSYERDLGIYFEGTDVSGIGVTQRHLLDAFKANRSALAAGQTITLELPITGDFVSGSEITVIKVMVSHGENAVAITDIPVTISDIRLIK